MTYTTAAAPYVAAAMLLLANGSWLLPVVTGVGFGLGRAMMPLSRYLSATDDAWDDRLRGRTVLIAAVACAPAAILVTAAGT